MTLAQLNAAKSLLNIRELARQIGKSESYLSHYLASERELPEDVQRAVNRTLVESGLRFPEDTTAQDFAPFVVLTEHSNPPPGGSTRIVFKGDPWLYRQEHTLDGEERIVLNTLLHEELRLLAPSHWTNRGGVTEMVFGPPGEHWSKKLILVYVRGKKDEEGRLVYEISESVEIRRCGAHENIYNFEAGTHYDGRCRNDAEGVSCYCSSHNYIKVGPRYYS